MCHMVIGVMGKRKQRRKRTREREGLTAKGDGSDHNFKQVSKKRLTGKMAFEQRSEGDTGRASCKSQREENLRIEKSKCKHPEVDIFLTYFSKCKKTV